jgi:hypothetical protein
MKKTKITLILGWLVFLCSNLFSQNSQGRFALKEGDWFEVQAEINYTTRLNLPSMEIPQFNGAIYLLNYQFKKQLPNNNQQYQVSIDHFKIKKKYGDEYYGYDSYYPAFKENKTDPVTVNQFNLEVTSGGKIIRLTPLKNAKHNIINLTEIGSSYLSMRIYNYSEQNSDSLLISIFSNQLMFLDSLSKQSITSDRKVPLHIKIGDLKLVLTDASFPLTNNAVVQGRLKDLNNQDITISMIGENSDFHFPAKSFRAKSDGSFACPFFLKRPLHLKIQVGNKALTTFIEPGDTLNIAAIGHQSREIYYHRLVDTKPNGYYSEDTKKSDYFSGNVAYNTMLSNELDQYRTGFVYEKEVSAILKNGKETIEAVNNLINSYRGKASDQCIEYFQMDFQFFMAVSKLYFKEEQGSPSFDAQGKYINPKKIVYPNDFFLEVDTMPILMNPYEWNTYYQSFIKRSQVYKQLRLGWSVSKMPNDNFMENYYFSMASLKGYPLYQQIAFYIDQELRKGSDIQIVQPYYYNFLNNCTDPALTEPIKRIYENAERFEIGKQFPFASFVLPDSSIFKLEKLKGKPICLVLFDGPKHWVNEFKENIEKFKSEETEFVFVRSIGGHWIDSEMDSLISKKSNVTFLELPEKFLKSQLLLERTRIFMLDKWFRIVENNAEDPMTHKYKGSMSEFEKSLRKTIETKRYSKAEKTAMIKTAGWSFGSILFTFLVGLWIYRIRIHRIKTQEAAKRRIKELEIKAIRSQMNPHFIFNALNSIQSLINGNQFKEANIYLSKFAILLRGVLNNSEKSRISLSDELQAVELYCQLEQLRFEFKFEINIDSEVNADLIEIPGMIIQPLAENAVVHGLSGKGELGKLNIHVKRQNGNLCVCVSDNGVGFQSQKIDELSQKGFGLKLVEERINILNLEGKEAKLTVENQSNAPGTVATLIIPID